ncbi:MAG TPA: DNA mismatch repair endonuclease MutL [Acidobacteriota bacterium]|nr:DNA mismatch repair endonuclease MutL [Acidobacteriota bacterium]
MSKIRVLPEILANKIAAGEIVERPASVVKELLENSIDAQCRALYIGVLSGGKRSIQVRDDGEGMSQDDAILAFEHHATSKLQTAEDLGSIATLGFRGEALPSIASVSRLTLKTRASDSDSISGTEIEIQGGVMRTVKPASWDAGTEITVRDLFFNVPARRKFLRSNDTELGHIARLVTHYALAHPEIRFTLESEGRALVDAPAVAGLRERVYQIFGDGFLENLVELSGQSGSASVHGFASRPHEQRTNSYSQFFYVNRRMVRDKVLTSALRQAYRNCMPSSAYPVVILFVELPYDEVDVNAHPAKTEIRFREQNAVHKLVLETIEKALVQSNSIPVYSHIPAPFAPYRAPEAPPELRPDMGFPRREDVFDLTPPAASPNPFQRALNYPFRELAPGISGAPADHLSLRVLPEMLFDATAESRSAFQPSAVRILGQLQDSYIIACDSQGLLIIDQHVAHERILYEKMAKAMQGSSVETQGLLVPLSLELSPHQAALLEQVMPELNRNGFQIEPFGGRSVLIRSAPAIAGDSDVCKLLSEILEGIEADERTLDVDRIRDRIAVGTACRAAIKVNMPLAVEKMQWLLDELARTRIPTNCPHGRPILLRFTTYEIERNFGRI